MFWKKSRALVDEVQKLVELCGQGLSDLDTALDIYYSQGCGEPFTAAANQVKQREDDADKQVFTIKHLLFGNFLLPESREDIARLLNKIDNIIDNAMHTTKYISLRSLEPIKELAELDKELREATMKCFEITRDACSLLFAPHEGERVRDLVEEVGKYESICDDVQNRMIEKIYSLPVEEGFRIVHAELIALTGSVSDACEDAAGIMGIMNLKRVI